ncbi:aquaporin-like protein [Cryphonectria parasitica EP155]|uniref:Aquaporin-like protein n=1 Tax=Cryphonectria parasitica (strain ATCC 38755 / EP155) TaxID=660469 RepID=A0A9P5CV57_CRYP1|nr:aquaporin-like protein [Cryphonectria parasitica EP155]KAF3771122.1 aquaporin-like protein [Cryphonectria parasitica EP155]
MDTFKNNLQRWSSDRYVEGGHISSLQSHLIAASGEFVGTFFFLWMAYSGQMMVLNQAPGTALSGGASSETVVFIAIVYGFSLLVNAWAFYRISGGLFNPAVALGMSLAGQHPWLRTCFLIPAQLLASMVAGGLVSVMFSLTTTIGDVNTVLASSTSTAQGLFIEMFLTAELVFVILMLAVEKSKDTFMAPIGIGLTLFVAELSGVYFTGGSLNPARSFGCAVAARSFPGYHWIYWLGPAMGGALAAFYYRFVKWAHYEEVNPGQDSAGTDIDAPNDPEA